MPAQGAYSLCLVCDNITKPCLFTVEIRASTRQEAVSVARKNGWKIKRTKGTQKKYHKAGEYEGSAVCPQCVWERYLIRKLKENEK